MLTPSQLCSWNVILGGTDQAEEPLTGKLAAVGFEKSRFEELTLPQVAILKTIFDSIDDDATK